MTLEEITNEYIKSLSDDDYVQGEEPKKYMKKEINPKYEEIIKGSNKYTYISMKNKISKMRNNK